MASGASAIEGIFQFDIENKVTNVGLRLSIAREIPDELDIRIDNLAGNRIRVYLKGNEVAVKRFYEKIKKTPLGKAEDYRFSDLKPLDLPECFSVESDRFFHKLQCEQMSKFVDVGLDLQKETRGMSGKIDSLTQETAGMREDIRAMSAKLDKLPERIAHAIKNAR
ncbi:MAG: hypothetical protein JW724_02525 [Candidatus Altiarchaeota archaeon]|nr:hypothetical protein [Candidatus Altiarchaeota archaeon]